MKDFVWLDFLQVDKEPDGHGEILFVNNHYHVIVQGNPEEGGILSIRRNDRAPAHDWRQFQRIKNELFDPECEAFEIYPAESRLMDTSNQFWLWVLPKGERIPAGQEFREVMSPEEVKEEGKKDPRADRAFQRPFGMEWKVVGQDRCTNCKEKYHPRTGCGCPPKELIIMLKEGK